MSIPTPVSGYSKLLNQRPAPPIERDEVIWPADAVERSVERQHENSPKLNTLACAGTAWAEWVMEPEVPEPPSHEFLQWPTRRAFVDDKLQIRVQIDGHLLHDSAEFAIVIRRQGGPAGEELLRIVSVSPGEVIPPGTEVRPFKIAMRQAGELLEHETESEIAGELDERGHRTYVVTTIQLPERPNEGASEHESELYIASVSIRTHATCYTVETPPLDVRRWWSTASQNLGLPRTKAGQIRHVIDGEDFFFQTACELAKATPGDTFYIAGWSTWAFVLLCGGPPAASAAVAADHFDEAVKFTLAGHIRRAVRQGASVHILLDHFNAKTATSVMLVMFSRFSAEEQSRIFIRKAVHPYRPTLGIGPFQSPPEQIGSYHEKYVCRVGSAGSCALVGGIDFGLDQYSPMGHAWICDAGDYFHLCKKHLGHGTEDLISRDLFLWHDIAVRIDGVEAVQYLQDDFVRRWNASDGTTIFRGSDLPAPQLIAPSAAGQTSVQLVKTENVEGSGRVTRMITNGKYLGTADAWTAAIREARHYIYMENQYIRDPDLRDALCRALQQNPLLQLIIVVPFLSEEALNGPQEQNEFEEGFALPMLLKMQFWWSAKEQQKVKEELVDRLKIHHGDYLAHEFVGKLRATDANRFGLFTLATNRPAGVPQMIYPHSKIMIVDDTWAYIGSANANGKSLKIDGEIGFAFHNRAAVTNFRQELWKEHLGTVWSTREIRHFLTKWRSSAISSKNSLDELTPSDFAAANVQSVGLASVRKGQKYNGPGSWMLDIDNEV